MAPLNLQLLSVGERVQHELLVYDRSDKTKSDGEPFVLLTLGNSSGRIETAPIWSNQIAWAEGVQRGAIVQAIGEVSLYAKSGKRQLQLTAPLRVVHVDRLDLDDFLPSVGDCTRLWDFVDRVRGEIESDRLRRVLDLFFGDDLFRLKLERSPGSIAGHHAKIGGLLLHVSEVVTIARTTARTTRANVDLVVTGALLHDIGKVEAYEISAAGFSYTPCGLLLGHVVLGCLMLERQIAKMSAPACTEGQILELQHLILSHHGKLEFGSPVTPMTVEAEIVHWADEASAKANDMMESLDDADAFASGRELSDRRLWRVGRHLWRRPHSWD